MNGKKLCIYVIFSELNIHINFFSWGIYRDLLGLNSRTHGAVTLPPLRSVRLLLPPIVKHDYSLWPNFYIVNALRHVNSHVLWVGNKLFNQAQRRVSNLTKWWMLQKRVRIIISRRLQPQLWATGDARPKLTCLSLLRFTFYSEKWNYHNS